MSREFLDCGSIEESWSLSAGVNKSRTQFCGSEKSIGSLHVCSMLQVMKFLSEIYKGFKKSVRSHDTGGINQCTLEASWRGTSSVALSW